jgi:hypothetical protein
MGTIDMEEGASSWRRSLLWQRRGFALDCDECVHPADLYSGHGVSAYRNEIKVVRKPPRKYHHVSPITLCGAQHPIDYVSAELCGIKSYGAPCDLIISEDLRNMVLGIHTGNKRFVWGIHV